MSDELLPYYERELNAIRHLAARFAEDHPRIAERLRINPQYADDPHVERLIEGFAYLTARIRRKIDDEFPEIVGSMLDVLYPHYQAPIPSMAIVRFQLDPEQVQATSGYSIEPRTELETEPIQVESLAGVGIHGEARCRFRTCYPVTLWPIELKSASLMQAPFTAPGVSFSSDPMSILRLVLSTTSKGLKFSALEFGRLRFFLRGQPHQVFRLYELMFNHAIGVALAGSPQDPQPSVWRGAGLQPVGFERDEGMFDYPARSFLGYRLLTEYFAFPQKFLFADLDLAGAPLRESWGNRCEVYVYLNRAMPELGRVVSAETFQLGCTPIVNLFSQRAEPIQVTHKEFEYQVVPDSRAPLANEVYSIDGVRASAPEGESIEFQPFFSIKHGENHREERTFWHASRRQAEVRAEQGDKGTEVFLALVDLDFRPSAPASSIVEVETTCLNRDLPHRLPFSADQPRIALREGGPEISRVSCLTPPTRTLRQPLGHGMLWRLVSHLTLNHLSLVEHAKAEPLREILGLYDLTQSAENRRQIEGIQEIASRRVVGSVVLDGAMSVCRGIEVNIRFAEDRYTGGNLYLFASVLERFLSLYCTVNSFSRLVATVKGREGELRRWAPRIGERIIA
jgi:type VI secretion system protein ImpG